MLHIKKTALSAKLFVTTGLLLLLCVLILNSVVNHFLKQTAGDVGREAATVLQAEISQQLSSQAATAGTRLAAFINDSFRTPLTLAQVLAASISGPAQDQLSREQVVAINRQLLMANPQLGAIYSQFEANAYDGLDALYVNGYTHSVNGAGSLEVYLVRQQDGALEQLRVDDAAEKHDTGRNERGERNAEWFLCPMETSQPCLLEPYLYEIKPGHSELMTSVTVPIIAEGRFRGVSGADIHLSAFQQQIMQLADSLYHGQAEALLLSSQGMVVASSRQPDSLGRPLSEVMEGNASQRLLALSGGEVSTLGDDYLYGVYQMPITAAGVNWSLLIRVPREVALADVALLQQHLTAGVRELTHQQWLAGGLIMIAGIGAMVLLVRTITRPLTLMNERIGSLNSAEGDLTRTVQIDTHRELIALSGGFNGFIETLRQLVLRLKLTGQEVGRESDNGARLAGDMHQQVTRQNRELESVVTAMNEMSVASAEVARFSEQAAIEAGQANQALQGTQGRLAGTVDDIGQLAVEVLAAAQAVNQVAERSEAINSILDVIRAIAEQTNLLALNAAIEAARAGEQGRGFAVVADEVRALAAKTRQSTDDIAELIERLNRQVGDTVQIMEQGAARAEHTSAQSKEAYQDLSGVTTLIQTISDHVTQMATSAEEQSAVSSDINRNLTRLGEAAAQLADLAESVGQHGQRLSGLSGGLKQELGRLKT
ncbi:methyl-accepting chemotaxis protein [Oceanimonas sp. MB9]|uniref:methyl-accepting chemotaxis protein n=1 Tax=Oceanimonas sp. MB9 TaxID=2588453 RepID=UPI0013F66CEF|nr:methyl-accepting chemotaxis protein [Oceanimonas sp. MB9]NHI01276.1 Methyl-accepting chemotaxis protein McpU [Oceanimonas sp. MB9]